MDQRNGTKHVELLRKIVNSCNQRRIGLFLGARRSTGKPGWFQMCAWGLDKDIASSTQFMPKTPQNHKHLVSVVSTQILYLALEVAEAKI